MALSPPNVEEHLAETAVRDRIVAAIAGILAGLLAGVVEGNHCVKSVRIGRRSGCAAHEWSWTWFAVALVVGGAIAGFVTFRTVRARRRRKFFAG